MPFAKQTINRLIKKQTNRLSVTTASPGKPLATPAATATPNPRCNLVLPTYNINTLQMPIPISMLMVNAIMDYHQANVYCHVNAKFPADSYADYVRSYSSCILYVILAKFSIFRNHRFYVRYTAWTRNPSLSFEDMFTYICQTNTNIQEGQHRLVCTE